MLAGAPLGCGGVAPPARATTVALAAPDDAAKLGRAFDEAEAKAFDVIAASDPRFAKRLAVAPSEDRLRAATVEALAQGDGDVSVRDGALDFFSFSARGRGLDRASQLVRSETTTGAALGRLGLERELAERLVVEERARLEEERSLPRGASALVRGIVETWTPTPSPRAAEERDLWLTRRLDQIRASLAGSTLPHDGLLELDDALDPLERIATPEELPSSAKAIARLRIALGETSAPGDPDDGRRGRVEGSLRVHLGLAIGEAEIRARLERSERATRALATEATRAAGQAAETAIAKRARELTLAVGTCDGSPSESRVRSLAPPPERAPICGILHALKGAAGPDPGSRAAAFVALHDETVVALWALALHADGASPARATSSAQPFFGAEPVEEAKLTRFAEARPMAAIGAGLAGELLTRGPAAAGSTTSASSAKWLSFGDAPLDVVERELFTSAPAPPASPRP
jgi:hypothetical protein